MLKKISPYKWIVMSFFTLILLSAFILSLPVMNQTGVTTTFFNNLFMATSALCVTGLAVYDLGTTYSQCGQILILFLIQLGGLGIITFSSMFILLLTKKINYYTKKVIQEDINYNILSDIPKYVKRVAILVFIIEAIGAILLFTHFITIYPLKKAVYYSIFHSISAFCNAGFALYSDSLASISKLPFMNIVFMMLIVTGGIGFSVILDFYGRIKGTTKNLQINTKFILTVTSFLIISGSILVLLFEYNNSNTLGNMSWLNKIVASFFQSITLRTAGFSTFSQSGMNPITKIISLFYMFIGASPGSTGGGIKTTTIGVIALGVYNVIKNNQQTVIFKRTLSKDIFIKAVTIVFLSIVYIVFVLILLIHFEQENSFNALFELISAFGTVGLSLDFTTSLHPLSKLLIMITMFIGRTGPLTLVYALSREQSTKNKIEYPEEHMLIG